MQVFLSKLLENSISASFLIAVILVLRLLLRKSPRWISCALWGFAGIRLVIPITIESALCLIPRFPRNFSHLTNVESEIIVPPVASPAPASSHIENTSAQGNADILSILALVWLIGALGIFTYSVISAVITSRKVIGSVCKKDNVYLCDNISTPFVMGFIKPKIYLPSDISRKDIRCVITHEKAHIDRLDYITRPLGFTILCLHWFNPLVWVAYIMFCRDVELACDEKVVKRMSVKEKKNYSKALIRCSAPKAYIKASPIAFAEVGVKKRIVSVLNYKKPALWIMLLSLAVCLFVPLCFMSNPVSTNAVTEEPPLEVSVPEIVATQPQTASKENAQEPTATVPAKAQEEQSLPTQPESELQNAFEGSDYEEGVAYEEDYDYYENDPANYSGTQEDVYNKLLENDIPELTINYDYSPYDNYRVSDGITNQNTYNNPYDNYAFRNLGATEENNYRIPLFPGPSDLIP